ncbi:MAG: TolC family protein [Desulfobacteraceae bacterium]|jgi:outer membrane protein TolC|nr:MAG: TolC family protein [Desulfobacteraceae bacterium]
MNKYYLLLSLISVFFLLLFPGGCRSDVAIIPKPPLFATTVHADDIRHISTSSSQKDSSIEQPLSLQKALVLALAINPDINAARARIRQSEALLEEARGSFWPRISLFGEYMQGNAPSAFLFKKIDQRALPTGTDFNHPGWFENYEAGIQGTINIFKGGKDLYSNRLSEAALAAKEAEAMELENSLLAAVVDAYYSYLAAGQYGLIAQESASAVENELHKTKVRYNLGGALRSDVLTLEVRLAHAKEECIRAENSKRLTLAGLKNILGMEQSGALELKESEELQVDIPKDYEGGTAYALAHRPEMERLRREIDQARLSIDMADADYLPRIDLQTSYYHDGADPSFDYSDRNWTAAVILNWDVFEGGQRPARIKKAKALLDELQALERKVVQAVELEVKSAYTRLADARERLEVARASVEQAEESLRLVKIQYNGGSAAITRYLEAEVDRNRARFRATTAFYDREKALASVARALGFWSLYARGKFGDGKKK